MYYVIKSSTISLQEDVVYVLHNC